VKKNYTAHMYDPLLAGISSGQVTCTGVTVTPAVNPPS